MKKQLEDMDVIDNFLFNEIISDDNVGESACREMLGTLLQKKIGRVRIEAYKKEKKLVISD